MSKADRAIRWGAVCALLVVTAIALVISYGHARDLVERNGERGFAAWSLPVTVDGLVATASLVLVDAARRGRKTPLLAWFMLAAGILATLGANVAHGLDHGPVGAVVAGWPAVVATGCFELVIRLIRGAHRATDAEQVDEEAVEDLAVPDPLVATARDRFAEVLASGDTPSIRALRKELSIGHPKAKQVHAALAAGLA